MQFPGRGRPPFVTSNLGWLDLQPRMAESDLGVLVFRCVGGCVPPYSSFWRHPTVAGRGGTLHCGGGLRGNFAGSRHVEPPPRRFAGGDATPGPDSSVSPKKMNKGYAPTHTTSLDGVDPGSSSRVSTSQVCGGRWRTTTTPGRFDSERGDPPTVRRGRVGEWLRYPNLRGRDPPRGQGGPHHHALVENFQAPSPASPLCWGKCSTRS